jgi:hypothetical protein
MHASTQDAISHDQLGLNVPSAVSFNVPNFINNRPSSVTVNCRRSGSNEEILYRAADVTVTPGLRLQDVWFAACVNSQELRASGYKLTKKVEAHSQYYKSSNLHQECGVFHAEHFVRDLWNGYGHLVFIVEEMGRKRVFSRHRTAELVDIVGSGKKRSGPGHVQSYKTPTEPLTSHHQMPGPKPQSSFMPECSCILSAQRQQRQRKVSSRHYRDDVEVLHGSLPVSVYDAHRFPRHHQQPHHHQFEGYRSLAQDPVRLVRSGSFGAYSPMAPFLAMHDGYMRTQPIPIPRAEEEFAIREQQMLRGSSSFAEHDLFLNWLRHSTL